MEYSGKLIDWHKLAADVDVKLSTQAVEIFDLYLAELLKWNRRFNLTGIKDPRRIQIKNFQDSMAVSKLISTKNVSVVDIGSGAGFPGFVLKIVKPQFHFHLIEPSNHRYNFLCHLKRLLKLEGLDIHKGSIEKWFCDFENVWKSESLFFISRAWKKPGEVVSILGSRLIRKRSGIIVMLGSRYKEELANLASVSRKSLLRITACQKVTLTEKAGFRVNVLLQRLN